MRLFHHIRPSDRSVVELEDTPRVTDVVVEIGLMLAVHLAFAFAVMLTLDAFGIG